MILQYTGNYNLKKPDGSDIVNIDDLNSNMDILDTEVAKKVDKVSGKGLSTNDFTTTEKQKLAGIESGAEKNKVNSVNGKTGAVTVTKSDVGLGNVSNDKQATKVEFDEHLADYIHHAGYGSASGTNAKTITLNPAPTGYVEGMTIAFKNVTQNSGAVTINVNGLGAKPILKSNGNALSSGNLKASSIYTIRYNGTSFILQGEGGEYGTAQAQDVLTGKTIGTESGIVTGAMPNRGAINNTITTQGGQITIPQGYHNGSGKITASFPNLVSENIKKGVNIGGVVGNVVESRYASGKTTITEGWVLEVRGLDFRPSIVVAERGSDIIVVYIEVGGLSINNIDIISDSTTGKSFVVNPFKALIYDDGFKIGVASIKGTTYNWYACK